MREIKTCLLIKSGLVYRLLVLAIFFGFCWLVNIPEKISLAWAGINIGLYYLYHYVFARLFKIGKE